MVDMRLTCLVFCIPAALALTICAQESSRTEAQKDDLVGPVRSVSTTVVHSNVKWQEPDGPTLLIPIWCMDCEYDKGGYKIKSGQVVDGAFVGETSRIKQDEGGRE